MREGPKGDKRWTAILSTDMANFTALSQHIGPEQTYRLLSEMLGLARDAIEVHGGHVVDTAGDGILAAFGAPSALENAPLQSCLAALSFHDAVERAQPNIERDYGVLPQFRTGIGGGNTMVAHISDTEIKVVGDPVNKAARLQTLANPGEIIVSQTIQREAEGAVRTTNRGAVEIKGFADPIEIYRLDERIETLSKFEGTQRRGLTKMVSRQSEMTRAVDALGQPEAVCLVISGAAGIGKSRLAHEIIEHASKDRPSYIGQCATSAQRTAYAPVFDILRQAAQAPWGADRATIFQALFRRYPDLEDAKAVARILAIDTQSRDQSENALNTRDYFIDLLQQLSARESCLYVIEDVHWVDTASNALISRLLQSPVTLLVTTRPGFHADWFELDPVKEIPLVPLGNDDIRRISETQLGETVSPKVARLIAEKAEGIPLMAEEITRALTHSNRLFSSDDGLDLNDEQGSLLTGNLEQLVLSRVDRLTPVQKSALQTAAAIGRDFSAELLEDVLGTSAPLNEIVNEPGLIEDMGAGQWRFTHALIRDAVYASLLSDQRQMAHLRIAEAIEASPTVAQNWGLLAEHFEASPDVERSVPYLVRAAGQSLSVYAIFEVDQYLERAMQYLETDPSLVDEELFKDLTVTWLRTLHHIGDFGRLKAVSERTLPRVERTGHSPALSIARTLTSIAHAHSRNYEMGRDLALRTLADAEAEQDDWGAAWAKVALMRIYDETKWEGLETIKQLAAQITPVADDAKDLQLAMLARYLLSSAYRNAGQRQNSLEMADEIEAFSTKYKDRRARGYAIWARALNHSVEGNPELTLKTLENARENTIPGGADERVVLGIEAFCHVFLQPPDTVRPRIKNLINEARARQDFNISEAMQWTLALLELMAGNLSLGMKLLDSITATTERTGNRTILAQCYSTRVEILLAIGGFFDPASEIPPDRPVFARKRPGLGDLVTYFSLRLSARRNVKTAVAKCLALPGSPHRARCKIALGLLAKGKEKARLLEEGVHEARRESIPILIARAEKAMAEL